MGALKHFMLPTFGLIHASMVFWGCNSLSNFSKSIEAPEEELKDEGAPIAQRHMLGILRALHLSMMSMCGFAVLSPTSSSDTRQAVGAAEALFFGAAAVDAYNVGGLKYLQPAAISLLAFGSTVVGLLEPGIFTKDHSK